MEEGEGTTVILITTYLCHFQFSKQLYIKVLMYSVRPYGKGKYRSMDITKIGIKRGNSYQKNEEISSLKGTNKLNEHTEI